MTAMPLLKSGCCWRVGSGDDIRIRKDKWIPNYPSNMALHPVAEEVEECMVSDLIDSDLHCWRRDFIMETFQLNDANAIFKIPLSRGRAMDSAVWLQTKNGVYSVRSGYHKARKVMINESWVESSSSVEGHQIWKVLWGLKIPSKLKVFGWRACHEILPTKVNLAKHKILEDVMCHCYKRFTETILHAVWDYGAAQDLNKRAKEFLDKYRKAQVVLTPSNGISGSCVWHAPPAEEFKLNFDVAVFSDQHNSGFGAIIRNSLGEVMAYMLVKGPHMNSSEEADVLACRRAVEFSREVGFSRLIIEGDCLNVMRALSVSIENSSLLGHIYEEIKFNLRGMHVLSINWVKRGGNMVTHTLAKHVRNLIDDLYWIEDTPPPMEDALYYDSLHINE
ncbi:uncharacterized protein LOC142644101 [Castanea sativa]|uniref:uncharacterized protein LOC142644101 n=1 Tax=Castanea sativa TaxID=21020 RepID=UPI003F65340C